MIGPLGETRKFCQTHHGPVTVQIGGGGGSRGGGCITLIVPHAGHSGLGTVTTG